VIGKDAANADATVSIPRAVFEAVVLGQRSMTDAIQAGEARVVGNATRVT
jgi:alkyl sulfatase BDS1-like metallo-beta-lactamase superfamily hydrolase